MAEGIGVVRAIWKECISFGFARFVSSRFVQTAHTVQLQRFPRKKQIKR